MRHAMDYAAKRVIKRPAFWHITKNCMDGYGNILHFPDGTYREQMATKAGQLELEMMNHIFRGEYYVNHRPSAKELFENPSKQKFEDWIQDDDWQIPIIEKRNGRQ